jgi:hypothetical protein
MNPLGNVFDNFVSCFLHLVKNFFNKSNCSMCASWQILRKNSSS